MMNELLEWLEYIEDVRQERKVKHKLKDIIVIVLFATLANVDDWVEMEYFAHYNEEYLKRYIKLENGIPSHDTLCRVFGMLQPEILQQLYKKWQELLNRNEGEALKKIICIDGKTMRGNRSKESKANHIVTAWSKEDGFSLGQKVVDEKSNEITAIPELFEKINIKGQVVTIDAMGTQTAIVETIRRKRGEYVLALKGNQKVLCEEVSLFLNDEEERKKEYRYYISSLKEDIELFSRSVRGHWSVESMHWHLDVTFKEDTNKIIDKRVAENLNIIRKWCISILKMIEIFRPKLSMKKKRFVISMNPAEFLEQVLAF